MGNQDLKILHLVAGDLSGGAARGAYWLHLGLRDLGVNSKILTNSKNTFNDENIETVARGVLSGCVARGRAFADESISKLYVNSKKVLFNTGLFGPNLLKEKCYQEADLLHLHWVNDGLLNVKCLNEVTKPIVWTMRDMWPMTGGCHYPIDCDRYLEGCGYCPLLNSKMKYDLSRFVLNRKRKYLPENLHLVGISNWLSDCASRSELFKGYNVRTLHNNINMTDFYPIAKKTARHELQLPDGKKIILVGAQYFDVAYKGFDLCLETLNKINSDAVVVFFGRNLNEDISRSLKCDHVNLGYLNDTRRLRLAYSAADVFVAFSRMEAFGKMLAEAMACGTPVACFDAAGPKDIVTHKQDGYRAKPFDVSDLAGGIDWILEDRTRSDLLSENAVAKISEKFDSSVVAGNYLNLYNDILGYE